MKNSWVTSWDLTKPTGQNPGRRSQLHWLNCGPQRHLFILITWRSNSFNWLKLGSRAKACWEISFIQWKRLGLMLRTKIFPSTILNTQKVVICERYHALLWGEPTPFAHKYEVYQYLNAAYNMFSPLPIQHFAFIHSSIYHYKSDRYTRNLK